MKRLTVIIPENLHTRLKVLCSIKRTDMSEVLRRLIEEHLSREEKKPKK